MATKPSERAIAQAFTRQQLIDMWMATDQDRSTLFDHLQRFSNRLLDATAAPVVVGEDRALVLDTIANLERINSDLEDERLAYWIGRMKQRSGMTAALAGD